MEDAGRSWRFLEIYLSATLVGTITYPFPLLKMMFRFPNHQVNRLGCMGWCGKGIAVIYLYHRVDFLNNW